MDTEKIEKLMKKKRITISRIDDDTGCDRTSVWRVVSGTTENPRIDIVKKIANALGVKVDSILTKEWWYES